MTDFVDLISRARETAAADRKWTTAPPRDDLLDELAAALERTIQERDDARRQQGQANGAMNRYRDWWQQEKARADATEAAMRLGQETLQSIRRIA